MSSVYDNEPEVGFANISPVISSIIREYGPTFGSSKLVVNSVQDMYYALVTSLHRGYARIGRSNDAEAHFRKYFVMTIASGHALALFGSRYEQLANESRFNDAMDCVIEALAGYSVHVCDRESLADDTRRLNDLFYANWRGGDSHLSTVAHIARSERDIKSIEFYLNILLEIQVMNSDAAFVDWAIAKSCVCALENRSTSSRVATAYILGARKLFLDRSRSALAYRILSNALSMTTPEVSGRTIVYFWTGVTAHCFAGAAVCLDYLNRAYLCGRHSEQTLVLNSVLMWMAVVWFTAGLPLEMTLKLIEERLGEFTLPLAMDVVKISVAAAIHQLLGESESLKSLNYEGSSRCESSSRFFYSKETDVSVSEAHFLWTYPKVSHIHYYYAKMRNFVLFGLYEEAALLAEKAATVLKESGSVCFAYPETLFYCGIALCKHPIAGSRARVKEYSAVIQKYAVASPQWFGHYDATLRAAVADCEGDDVLSWGLYESGIRLSNDMKNPYMEALGCILLSRLWARSNNNSIANRYMRRGLVRLEDWGAKALVKLYASELHNEPIVPYTEILQYDDLSLKRERGVKEFTDRDDDVDIHFLSTLGGMDKSSPGKRAVAMCAVCSSLTAFPRCALLKVCGSKYSVLGSFGKWSYLLEAKTSDKISGMFGPVVNYARHSRTRVLVKASTVGNSHFDEVQTNDYMVEHERTAMLCVPVVLKDTRSCALLYMESNLEPEWDSDCRTLDIIQILLETRLSFDED